MKKLIRRISEWVSYALIVMGIAFTLTSFGMMVLNIGKNPLAALAIGAGFFAAAYLAQKLAYKTCPRCGSILVEGGRCQVCDYELDRKS